MILRASGVFCTAIALVLLASTTAKAEEEAALQISPTSGPCGTPISVFGTGFPPGAEMIVVAKPDLPMGLEFVEPVATADQEGAFQVVIAVPDDPAACPDRVVGSDWVVFACAGALCEPKARVPFTVTAGALPGAGTGFTAGDTAPWLPALLLLGAGASATAVGWAARRAHWAAL